MSKRQKRTVQRVAVAVVLLFIGVGCSADDTGGDAKSLVEEPVSPTTPGTEIDGIDWVGVINLVPAPEIMTAPRTECIATAMVEEFGLDRARELSRRARDGDKVPHADAWRLAPRIRVCGQRDNMIEFLAIDVHEDPACLAGAISDADYDRFVAVYMSEERPQSAMLLAEILQPIYAKCGLPRVLTTTVPGT